VGTRTPWALVLWTALVVGGVFSLVLILRADARERAREAALTANALGDIGRSLDRLAASQAALQVRVGGLATSLAATAAPTVTAAGAAPTEMALPSAPPAADQERPRSAETSAADTAALSVIAEAVHAGQWTDRDRDRLREVMSGADADTREGVMRQLSAAVNAGKVQMRATGLPF
jgi:hypothetical protein